MLRVFRAYSGLSDFLSRLNLSSQKPPKLEFFRVFDYVFASFCLTGM
jgi:hypothetical protein